MGLPITVASTYGAGAPRQATGCHAIRSGRSMQVSGAPIDVIGIRRKGVHRAGGQAGLPITRKAQVNCRPRTRLQKLRYITRVQKRQGKRQPIGMPQAVLRVNLQHQRTGPQGLGSPCPLLERRIWWTVGRVDGPTTTHACQGIADVLTPAIQRIGQAIGQETGIRKGRPTFGAHLPDHPDHRHRPRCQLGQPVLGRWNPAAPKAQTVAHQRRLKPLARARLVLHVRAVVCRTK